MQNNLIDVKPSQSVYFGFNLRLYMKYKLEHEVHANYQHRTLWIVFLKKI